MKSSKRIEALASVLAFAILSACGQSADGTSAAESTESEPTTTTESPAAVDSTPEVAAESSEESIYEKAVASAARPESDRASDAGRRPAKVLEFMGIEPGMTVLDMFTGGGYYAEILSGVVGPEGKVIAQSNKAYLSFVGDAFEERFGSGRLENVEVLMAENNELSLAPNSIDAVMLVQSFHDLSLSDPENGWVTIDVPAFFAELKKGLRPGGIVAVIDHSAETGAPADSGNTLHRIDPAIVVSTMQTAGFVLDAESDLLRNPDDDLSKIVFAPEIRGKSDRFVMRFLNPE